MLAGGRGSRLGKLSAHTPKPMLPVGGRPFIEYLLDGLADNGIEEIIIAGGHLGGQLVSRYDGRSWRGARLCCHIERSPAGTGGVLSLLRGRLAARFFMLNGDSLLPVDWAALAGMLDSGAPDCLGVLALAELPLSETRYGTVSLAADGRIVRFVEKAGAGATDTLVNGGVYAFTTAVADMAQELPCSLEHDILPQLAARRALAGMVCPGELLDIGVPEALARAQASMAIMSGQ